MNRKHFISTVAGATASGVIGATALGNTVSSSEINSAGLQTPAHKVKRGVSLYSYQEALCIKGFTLENCFEELSDMGAFGFEFMIRDMPRESGYPNVSSAWIDKWWGWMEKYGTIPVCYCAFPDGYVQLQLNTDDEAVAYHTKTFQLARQLGFTKIRFSEDRRSVVERLIPVCEKLGLWMGREFHSPVMLNTDQSLKVQLPIAQKYPHAYGFVPDMGIFQKWPRPLNRELLIREGTLTREIALYIESEYKKATPKDQVVAQVKKMKPKEGDTAYIERVYGSANSYNNPKDIIPWIPYCKHIHGKCHEMTKGNEFNDATHNYAEVVPILMANGFDGYIVTEFEGQRLDVGTDEVDEFDEVRRWQVMMKKLIGV